MFSQAIEISIFRALLKNSTILKTTHELYYTLCVWLVHVFTAFFIDNSKAMFWKQLIVFIILEVLSSKFFYHRHFLNIHASLLCLLSNVCKNAGYPAKRKWLLYRRKQHMTSYCFTYQYQNFVNSSIQAVFLFQIP